MSLPANCLMSCLTGYVGFVLKPKYGLCSDTCQLNSGDEREMTGFIIQPESFFGFLEIELVMILTGTESFLKIRSLANNESDRGIVVVVSAGVCAATLAVTNR